MPEIKNTFTQGKMNKDLDERIVPNGQYRDAMNIQVSTSEGADVGTVQNILGNIQVGSNRTGWECVGSIADEKNDVLYSFIAHTGTGRNVIIEYAKDGTETLVLVDMNNGVLNFEQGEIITGINIVDEFLLWTDGKNEPKKINIQRCKEGTTAFDVHTKLIVDGEEVIDKIITTNWTIDFTVTTGGTTILTLSGIGTASDPIVRIGDKLIEFQTTGGNLYNPSNRFVTDVDYSTGEVTINNSLYNGSGTAAVGNLVKFETYILIAEEHITVIKKKPLRPLSVKINRANPSDKKPLFEKIFPRFSYRYRYEDGEYSAFAPFTDVVFNSEYPIDDNTGYVYEESTAYDTKEPYNSGMINMIDSIELYDFVSSDMPEDVIQIDILYKQENSTVVHVVEIIKNTDPEWGPNNGFNTNSSYEGKFEVKSENIYAAVPTNQLLRPWDNVPKTALAQEVTGNRVVYGNYKQSYDLSASPKVVSDYRLRHDGYKHEISYILDPEKIVNGLFNTNPTIDWTLGSNITWPGGSGSYYVYFDAVAQHEKIEQTVTSEVGKTYVISFKAAGFSSGDKLDGKLVDGNGNYIAFNNITTSGVHEFEETMQVATTPVTGLLVGKFFIQVSSGSTFTGYIDEVSVREKVISPTVKTFLDGGFPSVKSQRNYQLGVVYGDKYGRETPVFTSSESSVVIPWEDNASVTPISSTDFPLASFSLQLETSLNSDHPSWADYYKFFVKETSGEYYNLVMDALYNPTKSDLQTEEHVWLSFASSERNKISKDDYIILKKKWTDQPGIHTQITEENKFRVLDVKNEAPDAIKYKYVKYGEILNDNTGTGGFLNDSIFTASDNRPIITSSNPEPIEIHINKTNWLANEGLPLITPNNDDSGGYPEKDLYFSFTKAITNNNQHSEKYKIASLRKDGSGTTELYKIRLHKIITDTDSDLAKNDVVGDPAGYVLDDLDSSLVVRIEKKLTKDLDSFSGRFFVKIASANLIKSELEDISELEILTNYNVTVAGNTYYHADTEVVGTAGIYDVTHHLVNNNSSGTAVPTDDPTDVHSPSGAISLTDTENEWDKLLTEMTVNNTTAFSRWFIDKMPMVAVQTKTSGADAYCARYAMQGWNGGEPSLSGDMMWNISSVTGYDALPSYVYNYSSQDWNNNWAHNDDNSGWGYQTFAWPKDNVVKPAAPGSDGDNLINGLEGVVTTNSDHVGVDGIRRWRDISWGNNKTSTPTTTTEILSGDYGTSTGKYYLHLSYLAPGEDLIHDSFETNVSSLAATGQTQSVARNLQGIFGGGVFTVPGGITGNMQNEADTAQYVPMEHGIQTGTRRMGYGNGHNDNATSLARHNNQWNLHTADDIAFAGKLVVGSKFRFTSDSNKTVYTIIGKEKKFVYNHTPWRKNWKDNGTSSSTLIGVGNSVEETVIDWHTSGTATATNVYSKLQDFGRANNRRVVYMLELDDDPSGSSSYNPVNGTLIDSNSPAGIEFVDPDFELNSGEISQNPAIWETEPKDNVDLDIYYEAGQAYPITLTEENRELLAPVGCRIEFIDNPKAINGVFSVTNPIYLQGWSEGANYQELTLSLNVNKYGGPQPGVNQITYIGNRIRFFREDGSYTTAIIKTTEEAKDFYGFSIDKYDKFGIEPLTETGLSWYNCFSFGNGVESDRIRDDFNGMTLTNGVRANATLDRPYEEEHRKSGMIYSGLYNSISGINNLNQFIMAEKITKDLNPTYGSIQKLFSRRISLIAFCEDKVVGITANKNALYNADGKPQLVATNAVLGDANPFVGDYGISKNPESFAKDSYRAYFTDKQRGAVLRLSMDGLTPISDAGMSDWFKDEFKKPGYNFIGSFDTYKNDYNLTLDDSTQTAPGSKTITYSEDVKGWTSFKSFIQESGVSMSGDYYTFRNGVCWKHDNEVRNTFYGTATDSSITFLFNESPTAIKNFNTLNYNGDENWVCESITTDLQSGTVPEFIEKEGKWFNYIKGDASTGIALDTKAFNFQGIGTASNITYNV